jgi:hypothetical protein
MRHIHVWSQRSARGLSRLPRLRVRVMIGAHLLGGREYSLDDVLIARAAAYDPPWSFRNWSATGYTVLHSACLCLPPDLVRRLLRDHDRRQVRVGPHDDGDNNDPSAAIPAKRPS